jgi:type VI secretion system protein ImpI
MTLILTIENEQSLANGAPLSFRLANKRGLDIGRSANIDWSLPDPTRFISGKHCEVRYRDDGYWLNDLSTNGTFLNHSTRRIQAPHKLRHGDRLTIGSYIIAVAIEADGAAPAANGPASMEEAAAELASRREPDDRTGAEIVYIGAIVAPKAGAADEKPENLQIATPRDGDAEEARAAASALGFLSREFMTPGRLESAEPIPASPSVAVLNEAIFLDATPQETTPRESARTEPEPTVEAASKIAFFAPPANDRAADPLAEQALEAQAWKPPERGAHAGACQGERQHAANHEPTEAASGKAAAPDFDEFLRHFALGAGLPEHIFARQDGLKVAEELGALMRMSVENLTQLLNARFKAKRFARTSSQTMIQAFDNNPLKFAPTADDALKIMFGPRTSGYLDAKRAFDSAFTDLKTHQVNTFAAMQQAVRMLVEDLDPKAIDQSAGSDKGLSALFGGRKSRLWDLYLARWQAKTLRHEDGLVDAFMLYFAEFYDQAKDQN